MCRMLNIDEIIQNAGMPRTIYAMIRDANKYDSLPEWLYELKHCEQDNKYHPEGNVFIHTMQCLYFLYQHKVSLRAYMRNGLRVLTLATLLHDIAKPECANNGTFHGHEKRGQELSTELLSQSKYASFDLVERTGKLIRYHMAPILFKQNGAKKNAYKRLRRKLGRDYGYLLILSKIDQMARQPELKLK